MRNSLWLLAQPIILGLAGLGLFSFAARELGKLGLGHYSAATSFVFLFVSLSGLGLSTLATRDIARDRANAGEYAARLAGLRLTVAGVVTALTIVVALVSGEGRRTNGLVYLAAVAIPLDAVVKTLQDLFIALERARVVALANASGAVVRILGSFGALLAGFGIWGFVGGWLLADFTAAIFGLIVARRLTAIRLVLDVPFSLSAVWRGLAFYLAGLVSTGYQRLDVLILGWAAGHSELGLYAAAVGLVRRLVIIPEALGTATFAGVSSAARIDRQVAREMVARSMTLGLVVGVPIAAGTWALSRLIVSVLFGPEFAEAVGPLAIGAWVLPLWCASYVALFALTAIDREWLVLAITIVITVAMVSGLLLRGDRLDASWAAGAMLGAQAIGTALHLVCLHVALGPTLRPRALSRIGIATAAMTGLMLFAQRHFAAVLATPRLWPLVGLVLAGAIVYLGVATALGVVPWRDLHS